MKILKILLLFILFTNCKPKEVYITNTLNDTLIKHTVETIQLPVNHNIVINNPCDSLGILKEFKETFKTNHVEVTVSNEDGNLVTEINLDSIKQLWTKEYESHIEENIIINEVEIPVTYKGKWFWVAWGIVVLLVLWIFRKLIFKFINPI